MANLVNRATSDMLSGPDWAMNLELCDLINGDPRLAKDSVKALKKRMGSKNPKVQILALTVLETMVKNCGDVIHHQVATRDILRDMVKLAKKNKDSEVREKTLTLLDSWQEAFGGPNGRYPQYYIAYEELRRAGVMFRRRSDAANPVLTPPQTVPISSDYTSPQSSPRRMTSRADASRSSDVSGMSLSDMHNARSGMEVLAEMLSAIDPKNRQALRDEVIVELVEQCRTAERRVMQLVNSTSNEELLRQALTLNDDLKRVLAKHDAIQSGAPLLKESLTAPTLPATTPTLRLGNRSQKDSDDVLSQLTHRPAKPTSMPASSSAQLTLPPAADQPNNAAPPATTHSATFDLLSGDTFQSTTESSLSAPQTAPDSLALITLDGPQLNVASSSGFQTGQGASSALYGTGTQFNSSLGQMNNTNSYVVPWARTSSSSFQTSVNPNVSSFGSEQTSVQHNGSALSPQQAALIYGGIPTNTSSLTPQQNALIYGTNQMSPSTSGQQENFIYSGEQPNSRMLQSPPLGFSYASPQFSNGSQQPNLPYVTQMSSMMPQPTSSQVYQPSLQPTSPQGYQASFQPTSPQGYQASFQPNFPQADQSSFQTSSPQAYQASFQPSSPQANQSSFQTSSPQAYQPSVQFQPPYMPTQFHPEHSFGQGPYASYIIPSAQNLQSWGTQSANHPLPPAPWSVENTVPLQNPNMYANPSSFPSTSQNQQQLYQTASQFQHTSLSGHMQNLSLQGHGSIYYPETQPTSIYTSESDYATGRKQPAPKKEVKDDGLFKDLFDIAKVKK